MKAIILAAGRSSRLYPLTLEKPKSLLELEDNYSIIDHQIDIIRQNGINDITVVVGYKKELIKEHLKDKNIKFKEFTEYANYNNMHTLYSVKDILNDDVIIFFSDVLISYELLEKLVNSSEDFSLLVHNKSVLEDTMRVVLEENHVKAIGSHIEVKDGDGNFIGIAKYSIKGISILLETMDTLINNKEHDQDYYTYPLNLISNEYKISLEYAGDSPWIEMDFLEDYEKAKSEVFPKIKTKMA